MFTYVYLYTLFWLLINATHWINVFTAFGCYIGFGARGGAAALNNPKPERPNTYA